MNIIMSVLNWVSGGFIEKITNPLLKAQENYLSAQNDEQKLLAQQRIRYLEIEQEQRNNQKDIRLATAAFWEMRLLTVLIALPFIIHLWIVAWDTWDTSVNLRIPAFPAPFDEWQAAILLSFFGVTVITTGFKAIAGAIAYRKR